MTYFCYTDGACKKGEKPFGGWGLFIKCPEGTDVERHGGAPKTSSSVMEMTAIAEALEWLPSDSRAVIFSDSKSALDYCERWIGIWKKSDWRNAELEVAAISKRIDSSLTSKKLSIDWKWIRSHNGNPGNERADALAALGMREAQSTLEKSSKVI